MENERSLDVLPEEGIVTVADFAKFLNMQPAYMQQKLSEYGVKTFRAGLKYKHRLIALSDLIQKLKEKE